MARRPRLRRAGRCSSMTARTDVDLTPTLPPFTVQQAAPLLNVSTDTIYDAVHDGTIRAMRLGRTIRIPRAEISRLLGIPDSESAASA